MSNKKPKAKQAPNEEIAEAQQPENHQREDQQPPDQHTEGQQHEGQDDLASQIEALKAAHKAELDGLQDKMLRIAAEAENLRKRAEGEKQNLQKFAIQSFAKDLLPIADNLSRALSIAGQAGAENPALKSLIDGVNMTEKMLADCLASHGVRKCDGVGSKYNYDCHQAISEAEGTDQPAGHIAEVMQDGYWLHERLLRPAMVVVAK